MFDRKIRKGAVALAAAAIVALLATPAPEAATLRSQNLTQLIADSETIIQGVVEKVREGLDNHGAPYTEVTILVSSAAKGRHGNGAHYTFRQFGLLKPMPLANGSQLLAISPEGFPRWSAGESVVVFLHKPASRTGFQTTAGLAQGKFTLGNGRLANRFNNSGLFEGVQFDDGLLNDEERNMLTTPGAVDAGAFMNLVHRAVMERWIETGEMR